MKLKKIILVLFLFFTFVLSSCDPANYNYDYNDMLSSVTEINYVVYYGEEPDKVAADVSRMKDIDVNSIEVLSTLDADKFQFFLKDLSDIVFFQPFSFKKGYCDLPYGYGVQIVFSDGSFNLITLDINKSRTKKKQLYSINGMYDREGRFMHLVADFTEYSEFQFLMNLYFENYLTAVQP